MNECDFKDVINRERDSSVVGRSLKDVDGCTLTELKAERT